MTKLWQKQWTLNKQVEAFETGGDLLLDQKLIWADVAGSLAHAMMLEKIGILTKKELKAAKKGLLAIQKLAKLGKFMLKNGDEDIHTKIENYLTETCGSVGEKIHTGRSRNDQVLTAIRLFTKDELIGCWISAIDLAAAFVSFAKKYEMVSMPGYTHMQKAMPSSVGMWAGAFAESLIDDVALLKATLALIDQSPLGSAAGYGVPLPLDRAYTTKLLGFAKTQNNSLYCQNSRGKFEAAVVASLLSLLQTVNKFATDVLLFTTSEFGFFTVDDEMMTGSSIMPQKKNIDVAELLRSKVHILLANYTSIVGISSNLPSGYNRDLQDTKKTLMDSLEISNQTLSIAKLLFEHLTPNPLKLEASMTPEIFATTTVFANVQKGMAFRAAYKNAGLPTAPHMQIAKTNTLRLSAIQTTLTAERTSSHNAKKQFIAALWRLGVRR